MYACRQTIPAVEVEAKENRLQEKGKALQSKRQAHHGPGEFCIRRPEQTQFKRENRARHRADREEDRRSPGPAARQQHPVRVFFLERQPLSDTQKQW